MTFSESGMFSWAIIVLEKIIQEDKSTPNIFLGGQKLILKKDFRSSHCALCFVWAVGPRTQLLFSCTGAFKVHMWCIQDMTVSLLCYIFSQHQQCLALFNRIKFTRLLLTALITFTKKEVTTTQLLLEICKYWLPFCPVGHFPTSFPLRLVRWVRPTSSLLRQRTSWAPFILAFSTASSRRMTQLKEVGDGSRHYSCLSFLMVLLFFFLFFLAPADTAGG